MTNQTIDGVPRALLRWLDDYISDGLKLDADEDAVSAQLRALLDAPAVESELSRMTRRCQNAELALKVQTENYEALKAAQPQGEPVAYADPLAFSNFKAHAHRGSPYDHEWMWAKPAHAGMVPLYAEQPAPVAVALPVDPERERLMEIVQQYPNVDPLKYDAAVRTLRK